MLKILVVACKKHKLCYNEVTDLSGPQRIPLLLIVYRGYMEENLKKLRKKVEDSLKTYDIIVTDVCYHKENNYNFLTIELDKVNGIDLNEIVEATNVINPIVDELDFIDESYILDVISKERS